MRQKHVRLRKLALAFAVAAVGAGAAPPPIVTARPIVVAHRGGAASMPENTLPAFDNAVRLGVDIFGFDMVMTADGRKTRTTVAKDQRLGIVAAIERAGHRGICALVKCAQASS